MVKFLEDMSKVCSFLFPWGFNSVCDIREGFLSGSVGKEPVGNAGDASRYGFNPWVRKIHWRRK